MESPSEYSPIPARYHARPSLGFPLGTGLLLIVIFSLSGIFSCCYHWDKFRSMRRSNLLLRGGGGGGDIESPSPSAAGPKKQISRMSKLDSVGVIMPGDEIPRFIAMPCPSQPLKLTPNATPIPHNHPSSTPKPPPFPIPNFY